MAEIGQYINGFEVNQPNNLSDLSLSMSVTEEGDKVVSFDGNLTIGLGDLRNVSPQDAYVYLQSLISSGTNGGNGVLEAVDYKMVVSEFNRKITVLKGVGSLFDAEYDWENREISLPITQDGGVDWISQNTAGVSFEYLRHIGVIKNSDIILSPYVIEKQNQTLEKIMCIITGIVLYTQIKEQVNQVQQIASQTASTNPWVAVLQIAVRIAYIILLLKTLFDTISRLINLFIQPIKYIAGMTVKRHFEILFAYIGYKFESSLLSGDEQYLTIFPEKYSNPTNSDRDNLLGWIVPNLDKQNGYFKGYGDQFCRIWKEYFNAKFIVDQDNNIVRFERRDFVSRIANFTPPPVWLKTRFNREDYISNHLVSFQTDLNDRHTIQEYTGTASQVNISLKTISNPKLEIKGKGKQVNIPFSLFKIKTELSEVEKVLQVIFKSIDLSINILVTIVNATIAVINAIIKTINKIIKVLNTIGIRIKVKLPTIPKINKVSFSNLISERVGMFKMEDDIVYQAKVAYVKPTGSYKNNKQLKSLTAEYVQDTYHSIDWFTRGNQWEISSPFAIPVSFDDIYDIITADQLQDGSQLIDLKWNMFDHEAEITLKRPRIYLKGCLEETKMIGNGY